jgi:hypothetical protein
LELIVKKYVFSSELSWFRWEGSYELVAAELATVILVPPLLGDVKVPSQTFSLELG